MGQKKIINKHNIDGRRKEIKYLIDRIIDNIYTRFGRFGIYKANLDIVKQNKVLFLRLNFDENKNILNIELIDVDIVLDSLEITLLDCDIVDAVDILVNDIIDFLKKNNVYHYVEE